MNNNNNLLLVPDSLYISAENIERILAETEAFDIEAHKKHIADPAVPSAFVSGLAYTASWGSGPALAPNQLEDIAVGIQEHAIAEGDKTIRGEATSSDAVIIDSLSTAYKSQGSTFNQYPAFNKAAADNMAQNGATIHSIADKQEETEATQTAKKLHKQSAKAIAYDAQAKRVSRRLLLATRSKQLSVVCPITGIVSLMDVPNIPFPSSNQALAKALVWTSPFADLGNCRGIAQQGISYLRKLDTQVLAGILIVLADAYELFRFQPYDSGAQKNAILRTAGKDYLIDAIIMIEDRIHSGNCKFLPTLSLRFDSNLEAFGLEVRMQSYLKILAEAIAKPDKEAWDDKKVLPMYPIKPVYIKDVKKGEQKVSFLARQEQARAKKEFTEDKKAGKLAISMLCKQAVVTDKLKSLLNSLMADEGMLLIPEVFIDKVIEKLEFSYLNNDNAKQLVAILRKDRRALKLDLAELEATIQEAVEEEEQDDPAPGQEPAILEDHTGIDDETMGSDLPEFKDTEGDAYVADMEAAEQAEEPKQELVVPQFNSAWEEMLWKKKMKAAGAKRNIIQSDLPSTVSYVPSAKKENAGKDEK